MLISRFLLLFMLPFISINAQVIDVARYPIYQGNDLGLTYTPAKSSFRVWAPTAEGVDLHLVHPEKNSAGKTVYPMKKDKDGTWLLVVPGNWINSSYNFQAQIGGKKMAVVTDPYTRAAGVNGKTGLIVDLDKTDPPGWNKDRSPAFGKVTEAVIYELQVRDASIASNSGIIHKGKFTGLAETGTRNSAGLSTGLDHLKELGVTHIHLLPFYDFNSLDESKPDAPQYNWGYDPLNYNVPEGTFASNASDASRIRELKQLISTFHSNGLRVVMDVVYNHTGQTENSNFNQLVPGYYYRQTPDGKFSNATACGNETASERPMMRKFILESMKYWVQEYHLDGFRVDLMGVHDIGTMNYISRELHKIRPDIILYGEGWTAGSSPLPDSVRALKKNVAKLDRIAVFSDDVRDGIKGSVFEAGDKGFASGKPGMEESIRFGIVAACPHPQVDYSKVNYSKAPYATAPGQVVTYAECHDNNVLWDKLGMSALGTTRQERVNMHKLSLGIVLTSQGISFLHAGTEFLRTKHGVENSYNSPDSINQIDWDLKTANKDVFDYVKALIRIRRQHPAFRMTSAKDIAAHIRFIDNLQPGIIAYHLDGAAVKDEWKKIIVMFNGTGTETTISLPAGNWQSQLQNNTPLASSLKLSNNARLAPYSCTILYQSN